MSNFDYDEAVKKVKTAKPRENYLLVRLGYDSSLVLPHSDGMALVAALSRAEKLIDRYSESKRITELERDSIHVHTMSYQEYDRYKIAALLNCSPDDVKQFAEVGQPIPTGPRKP